MNIVEQFKKTLSFEMPDRLPVIEWATWWDKTLQRWQGEGLTVPLNSPALFNHFGLDSHSQMWIRPKGKLPEMERAHGEGLVRNEKDYDEIREYLYSENAVNLDHLHQIAALQEKGETVVWFTLEGFFWFPRTLFGIEPHMYAFYDYPELMHRINQDILRFNLRVIDQICAVCTPVFMTFAEDMSYNHGPMCSKAVFDEFMAPYYKEILPKLLERGITPFVDTDGNVEELAGWFLELGMQGFLPLERMAGVDVVRLRRLYPELRMIGAFDKTVMHLGEERIRQEFERLMPVMKLGGFIPSVDHQTPPEVSLKDYLLYLRLLKEYCRRACE